MALLVLLVFLAILIIIFAIKGVVIINQAESMVIERLGKFNRILKPGIHVIWPIIERSRKIDWEFVKEDVEQEKYTVRDTINRIDLRETVYDFPKQNVITEDNVVIEIDAVVYFQITDPKKVVYEISNLPDAIKKLTQTTLRNVIGELDLDKTLTSRDEINSKLKNILDEATDKWGVKVNRVELQDIIPPEDIKEAMEKQMRAERARRAAILQAEGEKRSDILSAEGKKEANINQAEGEKQAQILRAEAEKEARLKVAEGEAKAIKKIADSLKDYESNPAQYLIAIKYIKAFEDMADKDNDKVVYLPYEISSVLGSLGGMKELLTDTNNNLKN